MQQKFVNPLYLLLLISHEALTGNLCDSYKINQNLIITQLYRRFFAQLSHKVGQTK